MDFDLDLSIEVLRRSPATLRALLDGLGESWVRGTEAPETFSPFDVVGHLIDGEETLLAAWVVHDLGHVAQVARVMAKQYRDEVGPWVPFLPVLTDHVVPRS